MYVLLVQTLGTLCDLATITRYIREQQWDPYMGSGSIKPSFKDGHHPYVMWRMEAYRKLKKMELQKKV